MKILTPIFTLLLMLLVIGCGNDEGDVEESMNETGSSPLIENWDALEQDERNRTILKVALNDYGENVGLSCKEWVRDVIEEATNGYVVIPRNTEAGDGWYADPTEHVKRQRYTQTPAFRNIRPGNIVQMQWKAGVGSSDDAYNMHTAIVLAVFENGVIFIESNYDTTPKIESDAKVGIRFVLEREFEDDVEAFTVYSIR